MCLCLIFDDIDTPQLVKDTLEKAHYYAQELETVEPEVYVLFDLIHFSTKRGLGLENINHYLERLNIINTQHPSKLFSQVYRLARALVFKSSGKLRDRKKAHVILQQISEEEVIKYLYTRIAMINYSEILAIELKSHLGDEKLINELSELSFSISPIQFQQSYSLIAENFLYQSKSALAEIDIAKARELLKRAQYLNDFLELFKKGPTPFRIMFTLFIKERSLGELSELLNLTKGALTSQIKLLTSLDLVKVSRERQIRSATMLKKYYTIGSKAEELIKPFNTKIISSLENIDEQFTNQYISTLIPRLMVKMIQDTILLIDNYQHLIEEQVIAKSMKAEKSEVEEDKKLEIIKSFFDQDDEIRINQLFLTENQYKTYLKLWNGFNKKIKEQILNDKQIPTAKSRYIAHITIPIKELMMLERLQNKKNKD